MYGATLHVEHLYARTAVVVDDIEALRIERVPLHETVVAKAAGLAEGNYGTHRTGIPRVVAAFVALSAKGAEHHLTFILEAFGSRGRLATSAVVANGYFNVAAIGTGRHEAIDDRWLHVHHHGPFAANGDAYECRVDAEVFAKDDELLADTTFFRAEVAHHHTPRRIEGVASVLSLASS